MCSPSIRKVEMKSREVTTDDDIIMGKVGGMKGKEGGKKRRKEGKKEKGNINIRKIEQKKRKEKSARMGVVRV